jgi:transposase-like protein
MTEVGTMPRKRTSPEEIIHKLREAEILIAQGQTVREAAKQIGVTEQTYYRWRNAYGVATLPSSFRTNIKGGTYCWLFVTLCGAEQGRGSGVQ